MEHKTRETAGAKFAAGGVLGSIGAKIKAQAAQAALEARGHSGISVIGRATVVCTYPSMPTSMAKRQRFQVQALIDERKGV